jgi:nucleoside-diphosphate-sugar epimerase
VRIVVTGAMGFVGLNVTRGLARRGHDVIAVGRQMPDEWVTRYLDDVRDRVEYRVADLQVAGSLTDKLADDEFDVFVHAAVITATTARVERDDALPLVAVNVGGTMESVDVARRHDASRFVYVSSPSAIGEVAHDGPLNEDTVTNPTTIYGITKRTSEQLVRRYGEIHGISTVSARIAQPYGPGERATRSRLRTSPIYEWLVDATNGDCLVTGPLSVGRDWTYIDDTVRGIDILATAQTLRHDMYHLNRNVHVRVEEVIDLLRSEFSELQIDDRPETESLNPNIAGPSRRWPLDNRRIADEFGWAPSTTIAEGMSRYLDWWRNWGS